jgi:hypothetical protein
MPLPFELPPAFVERLGYRFGNRFVAVYWEPFGDDVAVEDGEHSTVGLADRYVYQELTHQHDVREWLWENEVNLGNSDESATHWLLIDRATSQGFLTTAEEGYKRIQQQRMENVE